MTNIFTFVCGQEWTCQCITAFILHNFLTTKNNLCKKTISCSLILLYILYISWQLKVKSLLFFFLHLNITQFCSTDHFKIRAQFFWLYSSPAYQFVFRLTHWHSVFISSSNILFWLRVFSLFYWSGAASELAWRFCDETDTQRSRVRGLLLFEPAGNAAAPKRHIQSSITSKNTSSTQVSGARFKSSRGYVHLAGCSDFSFGKFIWKTAQQPFVWPTWCRSNQVEMLRHTVVHF